MLHFFISFWALMSLLLTYWGSGVDADILIAAQAQGEHQHQQCSFPHHEPLAPPSSLIPYKDRHLHVISYDAKPVSEKKPAYYARGKEGSPSSFSKQSLCHPILSKFIYKIFQYTWSSYAPILSYWTTLIINLIGYGCAVDHSLVFRESIRPLEKFPNVQVHYVGTGINWWPHLFFNK